MALQPEDDGVFVWPPIHWGPQQTTAPEAGLPPPPPASLEQVESAAPPMQAAAPELPPVEIPPEAGAMQPGLGIPVQTAENAIADVQLPAFDAMNPATWAGSGQPIEVPLPAGDGQGEPGAPLPPDPYFDPMAPSTWTNPVGAGDLHEMAKRDPVAYAQHLGAMDQVRADEQLTREAAVATENRVKEEQNYQDLWDSQNEANALRDKLLNTKIDANRWRNSRSAPQSVAAFLSVVIGGLYQARKGGPNIGLQIIDQAIDRDIAEQQSNLEGQRNALSDLRASGLSDFQAKQAYRIATYQHALEGVKTSMQDYDPAGTTARSLAQQAIEIESRIGQSAEVGRRAKLDEELKRRKDDRETIETLAKMRKSDAETAKLLARGTGGGGGGGGKQQPEFFEAMGLRRPPIAMTDKEYKTWLGNSRAGAELTKAEQEAVAGKSQGMSKEEADRGVGGLKQSDGRPFVAQGTAEAVEGLRKRVAATKTVVRILDQIERTRTGWSPDVTKSAEWKQLKADWAAAKGVAKDVLGLGALSGPDEALIENYLGGLDPTGMRDPGPGLTRARSNMLNMVNDDLVGKGYDGRFDIQKPNLSAVEETPSDARYKAAQKAATNTDVIQASGGKAVGTTSADRNAPYVAAGDKPTLDNVVLPQVRREIDALEGAAKKGDTEAIEKLAALAGDKGGNSGVRKAAEAALFNAGRTSEDFEAVTGQRQQTARDTVPPLPLTPAPKPTVNKPKGSE